MRCLALLLAALVACGTEDMRSPTVEVISLEILAPACGAPQCHSTSTNQSGYAFDTLAASKIALKKLTGTGGGGRNRNLMEVLSSSGGKLMPPDAPLDPADIKLIETWIADGAKGL